MPAGTVQSIDRMFLIIETLSANPQGQALSVLAEKTGLHVSTAHRLVLVLVQHGYAYKDLSSGKYRLTLRLYEVGSRVSAVFDLLSEARPMLDQLAAQVGEAVHFVERDGNDVLYLYKSEPYRQLVRMSSTVGLRNPMYCTGVGKSILSALPDADVEKIWEDTDIQRFTERTITNLEELRRELAEARLRGYALDNEEHETDVKCVAAPIIDWQGKPVAAVSISAAAKRLDDGKIQEIVPQLLEVTGTISRMLGNRQ